MLKPSPCGFCKAEMGDRWLRVSIENPWSNNIAPSNFCDPGCIMGALTLQGYTPKPVKLSFTPEVGTEGGRR